MGIGQVPGGGGVVIAWAPADGGEIGREVHAGGCTLRTVGLRFDSLGYRGFVGSAGDAKLSSELPTVRSCTARCLTKVQYESSDHESPPPS
jgi:hypothetical protein